jgi:hypothetical protein
VTVAERGGLDRRGSEGRLQKVEPRCERTLQESHRGGPRGGVRRTVAMKRIRKLHLPYCVILLESKGVALLNRDYRLLGQAKDEQMSDEDYEAYLEKGSVKHKGLTRSALDQICHVPMRKDTASRERYSGWLYKGRNGPDALEGTLGRLLGASREAR